MSNHVMERSSPKGPGTVFYGYCIKCGKTGDAQLALEECSKGGTFETDIISAIEGPK